MNISNALRKTVASELNHIYSTAPFSLSPGVIDAGWYCREHAFHVFVVARALGFPSEIRRGHFIARCANGRIMQSLTSSFDHMWNMVDGCVPVDLSMNFLHHEGFEQLDLPIWGIGQNGSYGIQYAAVPADSIDVNIKTTVLFMETEIVMESPVDILRDPYLILLPPDPGDGSTWEKLYGPEIYSRITLHCLSCATGDAQAVRGKLDARESVEWINKSYPNALATLTEILS